MIQLSLFENSMDNQTIRALISLAILIPCDLLYLKLSENSLKRFFDNKFAYLNIWITIAIVFAVSLLSSKEELTYEEKMKNYTLYGFLIGLLIYVPLYNWIISCGSITGFTGMKSLFNTIFGVLLCGVTCLIVFLYQYKEDTT